MNKMSKNTKLIRFNRHLFYVMFVFLLMGFLFQWFYKLSNTNQIDIKAKQHTISTLEKNGEMQISQIEQLIQNDKVDLLKRTLNAKNTCTFYVYQGDGLIFWSDNQIAPEKVENLTWEYKLLSNVHALTKSLQIDGYTIVAYIPLKYNYPYENKELQNEFITPLHLPKSVDIVLGSEDDENAIFNLKGEYLFSLQPQENAITHNESLTTVSLLFFFLAFTLFFYFIARFPVLFGKKQLELKKFLFLIGFLSLFVFLSIYFSFPSALFQNNIFTPYQYASGQFLSTLTHLFFLTAFIFSAVFLFYYYVNRITTNGKYKLVKEFFLLSLSGGYFILVVSLLKGVIFNSSSEVYISNFKDISFFSVSYYILFLFWGISLMFLFLKTHRIILQNKKIDTIIKMNVLVTSIFGQIIYFSFGVYGKVFTIAYILIVISFYLLYFLIGKGKKSFFLIGWIVVFTLFITLITTRLNNDKKFEKFQMIVENSYDNEMTEEDRTATSLLGEFHKDIVKDRKLAYLVHFPDSLVKATNHVKNAYLRGFWNKYEVRVFATKEGSELNEAYEEEILNWGRKLKATNFYSIRNPKSEMTFLGSFKSVRKNDEINFYLEFYPRRNYKSYSFPNLLIENEPGVQEKLRLSSARYAFRELVLSSGGFQYDNDASWIQKEKNNYFTQEYRGYKHYIYVPDSYNYSILSEESSEDWVFYLLHFFYVFTLYVTLSYGITWFSRIVFSDRKIIYNFATKFLIAFTALILMSFFAIFFLTVNYMQQKYEQEQKQNLEATKNYIQMALQEKYYWQEKIDSTNTATLNVELQDLSYIYQTDIHVFDANGKLIGTSQPALFSREIISNRLSPNVFFSHLENVNKNEKIGNLEYLTAYTNFYNGDFLQLGFIAVPQFLSKNLIQEDVESLLIVIVHIYLIFTFLAIIMSLIITRQISLPLTLLQNSLKRIQLGQVNKKINYKPKDEVSQLVTQYNVMVEKLEKSAKLLAKSERESAWKTMARQVAHEINNPLTPMKLTIQHLRHIKSIDDNRFDEYFEKSSQTLIEQIENLSKIATSFSSFAKLPEAKLKKVDIAKKLQSVFVLYENSDEKIKMSYHGKEKDVFVNGDIEQLILVFNNLIKNAQQSIPPDREGKIDVSISTLESNVIILIQDNGLGIDDAIREKLFVPKFTTKTSGMGLGLSISMKIIQSFNGTIEVESKKNVGSEFKIILPIWEKS